MLIFPNPFKSFLPFALILEKDEETCEMLLKIIKIVDKPKLLLIASTFLLKNKQISFPSIGKTYDEIIGSSVHGQNYPKCFVSDVNDIQQIENLDHYLIIQLQFFLKSFLVKQFYHIIYFLIFDKALEE